MVYSDQTELHLFEFEPKLSTLNWALFVILWYLSTLSWALFRFW